VASLCLCLYCLDMGRMQTSKCFLLSSLLDGIAWHPGRLPGTSHFMNKYISYHCAYLCHSTLPQFVNYSSTPLLLLLQPASGPISTSVNAQTLPFKAYEPTIEIRDRKSRSVFIEAAYNVETGEAERIAVDWTARGGGGGTSCQFDWSHFLLVAR